MARINPLKDSMHTHVIVNCPNCGQKMALYGIMVQEKTPLACAQCNSLFKLKIEGNRVESYQVAPATGSRPGPAEGPERR